MFYKIFFITFFLFLYVKMLTGCYKKTKKNFQKGIVKIKKKLTRLKIKTGCLRLLHKIKMFEFFFCGIVLEIFRI